jgi:hypothetical protein
MKHFAIGLLAAFAVTAHAVDEASVGIKLHKQSGFDYVTGGAGAEAQAFAALSARYPVRIQFTIDGKHADDISGVKVRMLDTKGEVLIDAAAEGPLFFITPSSGRWTFEATWQGQVLSSTKDLTGRRYLDIAFDFKSGK